MHKLFDSMSEFLGIAQVARVRATLRGGELGTGERVLSDEGCAGDWDASTPIAQNSSEYGGGSIVIVESMGDSDFLRRYPQSFIERFRFLLLIPGNWLLFIVCSTYSTFRFGFRLLPPWYLEFNSRLRARAAFFHSARRVPAYQNYLANLPDDTVGIPETDKERYIKPYPTEARCVDGRLPRSGVMIDESSGSTGTPFNWVRNDNERLQSHRFISYFARYCYGREPWITINAFSMGAWATGINMGVALQLNGIVKNTGPEIAKILSTLRLFGPNYHYLITGYPPFLKHLIDVAEAEGFPFERYRLMALVGGEGMSEGLRDYLLRHFETVYSGYGATDIEIGIAGETPLSVAIRRLARQDPAVRAKLFGEDSRLPMLFQYNPLMHHIEVNEHQELLFTITRNALLSPRVRYNVHDQGGVARFDQMTQTLASLGVDTGKLQGDNPDGTLPLPFLWIYGRRDYTVSVMGANIYPEDLEQCLYAEPELARITSSFCLSLHETDAAEVRPCFLFEVEGKPSEALQERFATAMLQRLIELNADFREAWKEYPDALRPIIELYSKGEGPFAQDSGKIKQARLLRKL